MTSARPGLAAEFARRPAIARSWLRGCATALGAAAIGSVASAADLRDYPYPFSHVVTFASDIDAQTPLYGRVLHATVNERLGLPVSDSLWVIARGAAESSAFFKRLAELNGHPSGVFGQPIYGLLLREWHRGNFDHFHGWQDDSTRQIRNVLSPPVALSSERTIVSIEHARIAEGAQPRGAPLTPQHLRLLFAGNPPTDLSVTLRAPGKAAVTVPPAKMRKAVREASSAGGSVRAVELLFDVPPYSGVRLSAGSPELDEVTEIELHAKSCRSGCRVELAAIERDNFSRQTVSRQLPLLQSWNVRPVLLTSHGGWTYHQNFGALGDSYVLSAVRDDPAAKNILSTARALADDRSSHAFHSDLLKQLGVIAVWPLLWGKGPIVNHSWTEPAPAWISQFSGLYTIGKAIPHEVAPPRAHADLQAALLRHDPLSAQLDVAKYLCLHSVFCYQGAQGAAVELLVDLAMLRIDSGQKTDLLWHTHFGTANLDPTLKPSPRTVLHPAIGRGMLRLARHHYGVDGAIGLDRRVWVPAAGVLVRYRTMMAHAPKRVRIESGSRVIVDPWIDPVTGQRIPAAAAGTRDLHGLTVYVEDPGAATVEVGRESIRTFTRNPADQTGRPSITIVDNNTPTVMLDEVETGVLGKVEVRGGELAEPASKSDALYGRRFYRLRATAPTASVELTPHQLELWNVSHLHFGYRKHAASGVLAQGKLFIELELESGNRFEIVEAGGDANAGAAGGWTIDALTASGAWRYVTLDTAQMAARMPDGDARGAPPVPIGTVKKLRFGMRGAAPGETLDLDGLAALRANSNGEAQDASKLVAGQITYADGSPVANVAVRAISSSGHRHSTRTDQHGYYFFPRVARGSILEIVANVNGKRCIPVRGRLIDIRKNEAEIDINLAACGVEPSQRTRISAP